ncbi:glycosyltransferase [Limosilactobacillus fermentum]|uniref:glycosyltransferase n=1 Tax=Limosilactobacillus fermentum TaxID=1613 RepID=UPI00389A3D6C
MKNDEFPAFSVLMSVYKKEEPAFLDQALESIEDQTVKPNQIVAVVDGPIGSELDAVLKEHQNQNTDIYTIVRSPKNQGLGLALRMGTEYCRYDWIARMDSDDVSVPNRFELQLKTVVNNPQLAIVGGQVDEFTGEVNHITGKRLVPTGQEDIYQGEGVPFFNTLKVSIYTPEMSI